VARKVKVHDFFYIPVSSQYLNWTVVSFAVGMTLQWSCMHGFWHVLAVQLSCVIFLTTVCSTLILYIGQALDNVGP